MMNSPYSGFLKCCFHSHTQEQNPYTPSELLAAAKADGYDVLAVTEHDQVYFPDSLRREADEMGILLLPGIEVSIGRQKKHVLLVNADRFPKCRMDVNDLRGWWYGEADRQRTLMIAPHPFYPREFCLNGTLRTNIDLFDAVEFNYCRVPFFDPNRRAVRIAKEFDKPVVGTGDVHKLWNLAPTYTLVRSAKEPDAIVDAVKSSGFDDCVINGDPRCFHDKTILVRTRYLNSAEMFRTARMLLFDGDDPILG